MAFNITEFRESFKFDGARPNLFDINIPRIDGVLTDGTGLKFAAKGAQLPGATIGVASTYYFGREFKYAGNRTFPEWTVTILNDENFTIRNAMETWMGTMNGHVDNLATQHLNEYAILSGDATVNQYGKKGQIIKQYKFTGLFPVDIAPIDLDWGSNDTIEEYTVTFAYQYWTSPTSDTGTNK